MRAALTIAAKDLRLRVRDRSAFLIGIVAPFVLAVILNAVIGGAMDDVTAQIALVDNDRGGLGEQLAQGLEGVDEVNLVTGRSEADALDRVDDARLDAAIVIPEGFSRAVESNAAAELRVVGNVDEEIGDQIARAVATGFADRINAVRLSVVTVASEGGQDIERLVSEAQNQAPPVAVADDTTDERRLDTTSYLMAGMAVLFLFFTVQFGVRGLLEEKEDGTLDRLLAAPIPTATVPLAKALVSVVLGLVALAVLVVGSTLVLGADWGDPLSVVVLSVAAVLAAVSIMGIVAVVARTTEQANNVQAMIAMVLGLLGGSFFPMSAGENFVTRVAVLTPHHWYLTGLGDASVGGIGDALVPTAALLGFAVVVGGTGAALMAWRGVQGVAT